MSSAPSQLSCGPNLSQLALNSFCPTPHIFSLLQCTVPAPVGLFHNLKPVIVDVQLYVTAWGMPDVCDSLLSACNAPPTVCEKLHYTIVYENLPYSDLDASIYTTCEMLHSRIFVRHYTTDRVRCYTRLSVRCYTIICVKCYSIDCLQYATLYGLWDSTIYIMNCYSINYLLNATVQMICEILLYRHRLWDATL